MAKPFKIKDEFEDILADIADGDSVLKACSKRNISKKSFWKYIGTSEELRNQYIQATQIRGESAVDRIEEELEKLDSGMSDAGKARVKIDTLKWLACKFYPKQYGDKQEIEHSGGVTLMPSVKVKGNELELDIGDDVD